MTTTSNRILLAYAEPLEDVTQYIFARAAADDLVQAGSGSPQIPQQAILWKRPRFTRHDERNAALLEQRDVSRVRDRCRVAQRLFPNERASDCLTQFVEAVAGERTHPNTCRENVGAWLRD